MMKRLIILIRNRLMIGFLFFVVNNSVIWKSRKVSSIVNPLMEGPRDSGVPAIIPIVLVMVSEQFMKKCQRIGCVVRIIVKIVYIKVYIVRSLISLRIDIFIALFKPIRPSNVIGKATIQRRKEDVTITIPNAKKISSTLGSSCLSCFANVGSFQILDSEIGRFIIVRVKRKSMVSSLENV